MIAPKGRFYHVFGDIPHWTCKCGQPNSQEREFCLDCGVEIPEGTFDKKDYPNKGRFGGK